LFNFIGIRDSIECPHCNSEMQRIERKPQHRLLSKIKPVVRMRCCGEEHLVERSAYKLHQSTHQAKTLYNREAES